MKRASRQPSMVIKLHEIKTKKELARYLGVELKTLGFLAYGSTRNQSLYKTFEIQKKSGGTRTIYSPTEKLKVIQKQIANDLAYYYKPVPCVFGFVPGRSIADNAGKHINKEFVLNIDLADFFPSIHFGRVRGIFLKKPFNISKDVATWLAQLLTFEKLLPQGAPSSPIISNMICLKLDQILRRLAISHHLTYTRYADDITFSSGSETFPEEIAKLEHSVSGRSVVINNNFNKLIEDCGFKINPSKTRLLSRGMRQEVTGIVVNKKCNLPRKYLNTIRGELHRLAGSSAEENSLLHQVVAGRIGYLKQVIGECDSRYLRAKAKLNGIQLKSTGGINEAFFRAATWIIESDDGYATAFFAKGIGWVTAAHLIKGDKDNLCFCKLFHPDNPGEKYHLKYKYHDSAVDYLVCSSKAKPIVRAQLASNKANIGHSYWLTGYSTDLEENNSVTVMYSAVNGKRTIFEFPRYVVSGLLFHGMSGGPVFDIDHELVGIITHGTVEGGDSIQASTFTCIQEIKANFDLNFTYSPIDPALKIK